MLPKKHCFCYTCPMTGKKQISIKTLYGSFVCVFEREPDMGGYTAEADLQGAMSWGKTLAEAKHMIKESIEGAIEARALVQAERAGSIRITRLTRNLSEAVA